MRHNRRAHAHPPQGTCVAAFIKSCRQVERHEMTPDPRQHAAEHRQLQLARQPSGQAALHSESRRRVVTWIGQSLFPSPLAQKHVFQPGWPTIKVDVEGVFELSITAASCGGARVSRFFLGTSQSRRESKAPDCMALIRRFKPVRCRLSRSLARQPVLAINSVT